MTDPINPYWGQKDQPGFGTGQGGADVNRLHDYDDLDISLLSHHHTLGKNNAQASPGDHSHDGRFSSLLKFNQIFGNQPVRMFQARINAAAAVGVPFAMTDIPGCTVNFTTKYPNSFAIVNGVIDFQVTTLSAGVLALGQILLDGSTAINPLGIQQIIMDITTLQRKSIGQSWLVGPIAATGVHNLKMQCGKSVNAGVVQMGSSAGVNHTGFTVILLDGQ